MMLPILKLTLESMKHEVLHAFTTRGDEIAVIIEKEVDNLIKTFDFEGEIKRLADEILRKELRHFLERSMNTALWDTELRTHVDKVVREAIQSKFQK